MAVTQKQLAADLADERAGVKNYGKRAQASATTRQRRTFKSMQADERGHARKLTRMKRRGR